MHVTFIDREEELHFLQNIYKTKNNSFIPIYGRRRVGKTRLIKEFLQKKKGIYFLCRESSYRENVREFSKHILENYPSKFITENSFEQFLDVFKYIVEQSKKQIIVFDEFPYLIHLSKSVLSEFQYILDEILSSSSVHLILCGSSVSMMENHVLGYKSPLYGRRDGQIKLKQFHFKDVVKYLNADIETCVNVYGICGGVPEYLQFFLDGLDNGLANHVFNKSGYLYSERDFLLNQELREPKTYKLILKAISEGKQTFTEISNFTGISKTHLYKYLDVLHNLEIVEKIIPVTFPEKTKNTRYKISDLYFRFYGLIEKYKEEIELEKEKIPPQFYQNFNTYLGFVFEEVCRKMLLYCVSVPLSKIGTWWHKEEEIDIAAINHETKDAVFGECKWKEKVDADQLCKQLYPKIELVKWENDTRKEHLVLFAKSFSKKIKKYENTSVFCVDLKDIEKAIK